MMTREDLESYLLRLGIEFEELEDGMWMLRSSGAPPVVLQASPPVLLLRLKVLSLPPEQLNDARILPLYRTLLELNAEDIVHGSYGIEGGDVILSDALDYETVDFVGLRSSFESLLLAASSHMPRLAELVLVEHGG